MRPLQGRANLTFSSSTALGPQWGPFLVFFNYHPSSIIYHPTHHSPLTTHDFTKLQISILPPHKINCNFGENSHL